MKITKAHIEKTRAKLLERAKAKKESILFFEKGGKLKDFKPPYHKEIVRPF